MCCLKYEQCVYDEKLKKIPKIGAIVKTSEGVGEVCGIETLKEIIKVKLNDGEENFFKKFNAKDVKIIKDAEEEEDKLLWGPRNGGTAQEQVILCPYQRNVPWTWYFLTSNIAREGSQTRLIPSLDQKRSHSNSIR